MATITAYLYEHTLNVLCAGNKSECARKLGIRRTDLNRLDHRLKEGSNSVRLIEAILVLFWQEHHSLDQALLGYLGDGAQMNEKRSAPEVSSTALRMVRNEMTQEWQSAGSRMRFFKAAEAFMVQLELCFCSEDCRAIRDCQTECPCKLLADFLRSLPAELDRNNSA